MNVKKTTKTGKKREQKALDELQLHHRYMFSELSHKAERQTMQYQRDKTGKTLVAPALCIKLIVPAGERIVEMRAERDKKSRRPR